MDFNLVFAVISSFSFVIKFSINSQRRQDFFFLEGENQSAHLSRDDQYITLFVNNRENFSLYNSTIEKENSILFSWNNFKINDTEMKLIKSVGSIGDIKFDRFTFMSPIFDVNTLNKTTTISPIYNLKGVVNYWYIVTIVLIVGVLLESKVIGFDLAQRLIYFLRFELVRGTLNQVEETEIECTSL